MAVSENLIMAVANAAPRTVQRLLRTASQSEALLNCFRAATLRTIARVKRAGRIGVVADTNIGDAVVLQGACTVLKHWLPNSRIDYFYQQKAHPLVRDNPFINGHEPVFADADFTSSHNRQAIQSAVRGRQYDLILNLYPFLMNSELSDAGCPVLTPYTLIGDIIRSELNPFAKAHVSFHLHRYAESVARALAGSGSSEPTAATYGRNTIYLSKDVPHCAREVLLAAGVKEGARLAFLNPDSSSRFSCIPVTMQIGLLRGLLESEAFDSVLLGPAYIFTEVPDELCAAVAGHPRLNKLVSLPQGIPIDIYAGLVDRARLFITADTAQMHIAAAFRDSPGVPNQFLNRTTLVSIFGATPSRVYGYDSFSAAYIDSSQHAPAKVFEGAPFCKNLTCVHKTRKTCSTVECFSGLTAESVLDWIKKRDWSKDSDLANDLMEPIIIVSGLPRSGTSMMMQMLHAGGVSISTDGLRTADQDNPRGYYELERVKQLDRDVSWLSQCKGKAVKVISLLLPALPPHHEYRIIFMERALSEVMASQKTMQERRGTLDPHENDQQIAASYERHLASIRQTLAARPRTKTLFVSYREAINAPRRISTLVCEFLERQLDVEGMVHSVDPNLYRNKRGSLPLARETQGLY